jgi:cation transport protein ChaC
VNTEPTHSLRYEPSGAANETLARRDARDAVRAPVSLPAPIRDPGPLLERTIAQWGGSEDLWIFGYGSLIWRPDFEFAEQRTAVAHGWHRALHMWSRLNRGTPECPGLVFALLSGGSCRGVAFRVPAALGMQTLATLWPREMPTGVYDPRWLACQTREGRVRALAFTLSRASPNHAGALADDDYRRIFLEARGRYGTTLEYVQQTHDELVRRGMHDPRLARLLKLSHVEEDQSGSRC